MRLRPSLAPLLLILALAALTAPALAQEPAVVSLQPVAFVPLEGETFTTEVRVENAQDLLGFQFDVAFDPAAFAVEAVELGPFLSSSGRSAQPLGPDLRDAANGRVVYGGFTLGAPDLPGAAGSGVLAVITWRVLQPADFTATLSRVQLAGPGGQALPGSAASPRPPAEALPTSQAVVEQPTATPEPATPEEASPGSASLLTPLAVGVILLLAGALYALWRISHKPGGNRAS